MLNDIKNLFNWKEYPQNVFYLAIPLFVLGMSFAFLFAVLKGLGGDWGYAIIFFSALALYIFALLKIFKVFGKIRKELSNGRS